MINPVEGMLHIVPASVVTLGAKVIVRNTRYTSIVCRIWDAADTNRTSLVSLGTRLESHMTFRCFMPVE